MKFRVFVPMATIAAILITATSAQAGQTGMAAMHEQRVVGGRLCFTDHEHVGVGQKAPTKKVAIRYAARDWSAFTAFEYGSDWAHWRFARGKKVLCQRAGSGYKCEVQARPCLAKRVRNATR